MEHKAETKNCQNCKSDFTIEPEDFAFYEKIKVPPPTFCPECRQIRRLIWRNEKSLYKRTCSLCSKDIISVYDQNVPFPVYCLACYKSDKWDASSYGIEYNFSRPFFEQFRELFNKVPRQSLRQIGDNINCDYANFVDSSKNVYLSNSVIWGSEDIYFSSVVDTSKQILDSFTVTKSELLYENISANQNYNCKYTYWSSNCIDCNFVQNCSNCQNCFGCVELVNQKYCIWNKQYSKDEYEKILNDFDLGSYTILQQLTKEFSDFIKKFPQKYARNVKSVNCTGDELRDCNNVHFGFNCYGTENAKFSIRSAKSKDIMDADYIACELAYEHALGGSQNSQNVKFIIDGQPNCSELEYCDHCHSSSNLFGCIALKSKDYCILNKAYSKEEYKQMIDKIKHQMQEIPYIDNNGLMYKYGEFFPIEFCPFGYNESVANDFFPLTKEEIQKVRLPYKEKYENKYTLTKKANELPDHIKDVDESILDEVIECEKSGKAFKVTKYEFDFHKRMNIPIPRLHPDERYKNRLALRNPLKLWHRQCMCTKDHPSHTGQCEVEFETSYSPDRPEKVYCEKCYQQEVY